MPPTHKVVLKEGIFIMTQLIATISLVVFVAVMLLVGIYSTKKAGTVEGFLLGGRSIGPWISAFAYGTTYFSAVIFIGYAGMFGWNIGLSSMWIGIGNALLSAASWRGFSSPEGQDA